MNLKLQNIRNYAAIMASTLLFTIAPVAANAGKIIVNGSGSVRLAPDIATVSIGVNTNAEQPEQAQADNTKYMNALIEAIESLGIKRSDMQTSSYSIQRLAEDRDAKTAKKPVYQASNSLNILIRDLDKIGLVIGTAIKNGGNDIGQLHFSVSKPQEYVAKALKRAFDDAHTEAELSARASGLKLGKVVEVSQGRATLPQQKEIYGEADISDQPYDPSLSPITLEGKVEIGYEVTVEYELN
jgi:uncharacterized protein